MENEREDNVFGHTKVKCFFACALHFSFAIYICVSGTVHITYLEVLPLNK